jgi:hypothetical protein
VGTHDIHRILIGLLNIDTPEKKDANSTPKQIIVRINAARSSSLRVSSCVVSTRSQA